MQPARKPLSGANAGCLACECEEGRLKGILSIGCAAQPAPRDTEHHASMAPDEHLEGRLIPAVHETVQNVRVIQDTDLAAAARMPQALDQLVQGIGHPFAHRADYGNRGTR